MSTFDARIDALYQSRPNQFTAARGALAKQVPTGDASRVRGLKKPTVVPWAVNQVYWKARPLYDRLVRSGQALRAAQLAALEGRSADMRKAGEVHRQAVAEAVRTGQSLAAAEGLKPDPHQLARMFEALSLAIPHPGTPGRLAELLQPAGFEALAGVSPAPTPNQTKTSVRKKTREDRGASAVQRKAAARERAEQGRRRRRAEAAVRTATKALEASREAAAAARTLLERREREVRNAEEGLGRARALLET